jgi:hypothetical protein
MTDRIIKNLFDLLRCQAMLGDMIHIASRLIIPDEIVIWHPESPKNPP